MTSNPHPEHGPLWVERNSRRSAILARPHALMGGDDLVGSLYPHQADAIEAQITPLPDGVYRKGDGFRLAAMFPVADGWTRVADLEHRRDVMAITTIIRRVPAEPPAPPTEDVPLHELCGRKLPGCDWVIRGVNVDKAGVTVRDHQLLSESRNLWTVDLNPDGTVTVQGQAVESC